MKEKQTNLIVRMKPSNLRMMQTTKMWFVLELMLSRMIELNLNWMRMMKMNSMIDWWMMLKVPMRQC